MEIHYKNIILRDMVVADIEDEIRHAGWRTLVFALVPENITGKRVKES